MSSCALTLERVVSQGKKMPIPPSPLVFLKHGALGRVSAGGNPQNTP